MPTASDELRARMGALFGDPIDDQGPARFLRQAGYVQTPEWEWKPRPGVSSYDDMTDDEYDCLTFLIDEWDMGGLALSLPSGGFNDAG